MDNSLISTEEQSISTLEYQNWRNVSGRELSAFSQDEVMDWINPPTWNNQNTQAKHAE